MDTRRSVVGICAPILAAAIGLAGRAHAQIAGDNVNMVSGIQWPGGDPYLQRQNEPTLAVSSVNPQHLMAGANDYRSVDVPDPVFGQTVAGDSWMGVFKSLDGGQTWKSVLLAGYPQECKASALANAPENARRATLDPPLPPLPLNPLCGYPATADPVMRAGTDGLFYLAGINFQRDKSASRLFVARFIDDNNKENGSATGAAPQTDPTVRTAFAPTDPIRYIDTVEVWSSERHKKAYPLAPPVFMDKPWIAVDVPRQNRPACSIKTAGGDPIQAGAIYMAWVQFQQTGVNGTDDYQSDVMLSASFDCGATWTFPTKLNTANSLANQGVAVAVEPITGRVYVAWRRAAWPALDPATGVPLVKGPQQTPAIMVTRSEGRQRTFSAPRAVAKLIPFDMGSGYGRARTQTMPALAIATDGTSSWAHVAYSARIADQGAARIFVTQAKIHPIPPGDGDPEDPEEWDVETRIVWSTPAQADPAPPTDDVGNAFTRGHQYMPSLTFGQGRLMLLYYDTRLDHTVRFYRPIPKDDPRFQGGKFYEEELAPQGELTVPGGDSWVFNFEVNDRADEARYKARRHNVDVRVASLPWGGRTASGGTLVSRFPLGIRGDEALDAAGKAVPPPVWVDGFGGKLQVVGDDGLLVREQQLQLNIAGFPIFKNTTVAFLGDYIDIQGPAFVARPNHLWAFNTAPTPSPVFHAVWTSNQDVRTPADGHWENYTPVSALAGLPVLYDGGRAGSDPGKPPTYDPVGACLPGSAGSRDQNVYTSRITEGLEVTSPQNVKLLASGSPTSFVVAARNETATPMSVRIFATADAPVAFPPPASSTVDYSFTPDFGRPLTALCATIAPHGSVTRTLFAQLKGIAFASTTLYVQVDEVTSCPASGDLASVVTTGRSGSLTLNPPVAFNSLVQPDGPLPDIASGEVYALALGGTALSSPNPTLGNPTLGNPTLGNPTLGNPTLGNPTLGNPTLGNPTLGNVTLTNPTLGNPTLGNPTLGNPTLGNDALTNPTLGNPTLGNASVADDGPWDWSQTITNTGNTTTSYHVKVVGTAVDATKPLQLVLSKTYYTNGVDGCELKVVPHDQVFVSVPDVRGAIVSPGSLVDPGASGSSVANATLSLAPGESAAITLRGFMSLRELAGTVSQLQTVTVPASVPPPPAGATGPTYATFASTGQPPLLRAATVTTVGVSAGTFTASVALDPSWPTPPAAPPTGEVVFMVDGSTLGATVALSGGTASFTPAPPLSGTSTVTALYLGDANYAASTSGARGSAPQLRVDGPLMPTGRILHVTRPDGTVVGTATVSVTTELGGATTSTEVLAFNAASGNYESFTATPPQPGMRWTVQIIDGMSSLTGTAVTPPEPVFTAPAPGAFFHPGDTITVSWTVASPPPQLVNVGASWTTSSYGWPDVPGTAATTTIDASPIPAGQPVVLELIAKNRLTWTGDATADSAVGVYTNWPTLPIQVSTAAWTTTGDLLAAKFDHTATLLPSGAVLAAGGGGIPSSQLYDPATGSWSPTDGAMITNRSGHTATPLLDGRVLVAGGGSGFLGLTSAEIYDPATRTWSATAPMSVGRYGHTATLLATGTVLVTGGIGPGSTTPTATAEVYDPRTGTWSATGSLSTARMNHAAVRLPSGRVLVAGGRDMTNPGAPIYLASAELYDPAAGTWTPVGSLAGSRWLPSLTVLGSGRVLAAGGYGGVELLASAEVFDPAAGTWAATGSLNQARGYHTATLLGSGEVLVVGQSATTELYDPATGSWRWTASLNTARMRHAAALLASGQVLVCGGADPSTSAVLGSAEVYTPGP